MIIPEYSLFSWGVNPTPYSHRVNNSICPLIDGRPDLPILCNVNFGHAEPIGILPIGARCRLDADQKTLTLLEPATE